jgi:hypothetical protein
MLALDLWSHKLQFSMTGSHFLCASFFLMIGSTAARKFSSTQELAFKQVFLDDRLQPY